MAQAAPSARSGQIVDLEDRTKPRPAAAPARDTVWVELDVPGVADLRLTRFANDGRFALDVNGERVDLHLSQVESIWTQLTEKFQQTESGDA